MGVGNGEASRKLGHCGWVAMETPGTLSLRCRVPSSTIRLPSWHVPGLSTITVPEVESMFISLHFWNEGLVYDILCHAMELLLCIFHGSTFDQCNPHTDIVYIY